MKKTFATGICLALSVLLLAACFDSLSPDDKGSGEPDKLTVDLYKLTLSNTELATIGGHNLKLDVDKQPEFATRGDVVWSIKGSSKIAVDQNGNISTQTVAIGQPSEAAVVRVEAVNDPSVYAVCSVSIFPDYGTDRYWNLGDKDWDGLPANVKAYFTQNGMAIPYNADEDWGNGLVRRGGTGAGSYNFAASAPDGKPLENGLPAGNPEDYPPYPWIYEIDPEAPYAEGLEPSGGNRGGMTFNNTANSTALDPIPALTGRAEEWAHWKLGAIRTGGIGRIFSIAAIEGPFNIEVRYASNDASQRWADLRFGDKEGLRVQGSPASGTTASAAIGGIASYDYVKDDVVPFVYVECSAAIRLFEIIIKPITVAP